jgi:hypothetical protein
VLPTENAAYQSAAYQSAACGSELGQLVEALPFCESADDFASVVEDYPSEVVEDAIALLPTQPERSRLRQMWEILTEQNRL